MCQLETVPVKEIIDLGKAKKLNLSYNALSVLPVDFVKLTMIREMDLSKNRLTCLPKNFGLLVNLKTLDLLGNELTELPSSFCELRSLQWLDLKDNPLSPQLKQASGDCLNETQCKKCAVNVMRFVKQQASDEERDRQLYLKKKKEEQAKKEAIEREKELKQKQEQKLLKQQEREQRRILNEARKLERAEQESENDTAPHGTKSKSKQTAQHKMEKSGSLRSLLSWIFVLSILGLISFVLLESYCFTNMTKPESFKLISRNQYIKPILATINEKACIHFDNKTAITQNILKYFNLLNVDI
jgi:hypothetical protein